MGKWKGRYAVRILLKIAKKGEKGYHVASVPMKKLKRLAKGNQRFWNLEGEFLILQS
jgi:hypothetical protein